MESSFLKRVTVETVCISVRRRPDGNSVKDKHKSTLNRVPRVIIRCCRSCLFSRLAEVLPPVSAFSPRFFVSPTVLNLILPPLTDPPLPLPPRPSLRRDLVTRVSLRVARVRPLYNLARTRRNRLRDRGACACARPSIATGGPRRGDHQVPNSSSPV